MKTDLKNFFSGPFYEMISFLDEKKTCMDFEKYFVHNTNSPIGTDESDIREILLPESNNLYKIAIILQIFCFQNSHMIPPMIASFLELCPTLTSYVGIEKAQFLLLHYFYNSFYNKTKFWDDSIQLLSIVSELIHCCTTLGLYDVERWYSDLEDSVGDLESLKNTFYWSLFVDVVTSIHFGKSLFISSNYLHVGKIFDPNVNFCLKNQKIGRRGKILKRFLRLSINYVNQLSNMKISYPKGLIKDFFEFCDDLFLPLHFYTNSRYIPVIDNFDVLVLSRVLGIVTNLYHIQIQLFNDTSISTTNSFFKTSLMSMSLCATTLLPSSSAYFTFGSSADKELQTMYCNHYLSLVSPLMVRTLYETYTTALSLLISDQGALLRECDEGIITFENLSANVDRKSLLSVLQRFEGILNDFMQPKIQQKGQPVPPSRYLISIFLLFETWKYVFTQAVKDASIAQETVQKKEMNCSPRYFENIKSQIHNKKVELSDYGGHKYQSIIKEVIDRCESIS